MTALTIQNLAQVFTGRLLNTAIEGFLLIGMVWLLLRLVGRQNSGTRFALWFSALLAIVALPFLANWGFDATNWQTLPDAGLHGKITLSESWAINLFAAWAAGAGALFLRLGVGLWRVHRLRRACGRLEIANLDSAIGALFNNFESRRVELCVSSDVAVPAAIGFFHAAIVFPAGLLPQLSVEEIKVIVLHELAHLRRRDDWTNLAQKVVKALFFFHPAVWWIESRLTLEREMACDDMVLAQTASARAYASSLISFAEKMHNARGLALAQALMSRMRQMSLRIAQILDSKRPSQTALWKPVLGVNAALVALVFGAAAYAPHLVTFQNQPKQVRAALIERQLIEPAGDNRQAMTLDADATDSSLAAALAHSDRLAPQPRVIPAAFHLRTAEAPPRLKTASQRKTRVIRVAAEPRPQLIQPTFVILQTTRWDASGAGIWTLCIWRVGGVDSADRQLESAIVVAFI